MSLRIFYKALCAALLECQPQNGALRKIVSHPSFDNAPDEFANHAISALSGGEGSRLAIGVLLLSDGDLHGQSIEQLDEFIRTNVWHKLVKSIADLS